MLLEAISIGASLLGGVMNSNAADKASDRQQAAEQAAFHAQQRTAQQVQQLQAPGVAAYNTGLNALTQRLGLPTAGIASSATKGGSFNATEYLQANPDVAAEYGRLSPNNLKNNLGVSTPEQFAQWHYNQYGKYEARPGSPSEVVQSQPQPAAPSGTGTAPTNNLAGSFGNVKDPTWTAPAAFSFDPSSFENSTGYKWAQEQGSGQVMANASATGALQSGAALKALQDRGQKTAYDFYDKERGFAYDRWSDDYNRAWNEYTDNRNYLTNRYDRGTDDLMRYIGVGQNALNTTTNSLNGLGAAESAGLQNIGEYSAQNALAQGSIWSGVAQDVLGGISGLINGKSGAKSGATKNRNN